MASILRRGKRYLVRWRDPDGIERARTAPDFETARRLRVDVERSVALGHRWEPADARAVPQLLEVGTNDEGEAVATGGLFFDYLSVARARLAPGTYRHYDRALRRFVSWLSTRHPTRRRLSCDLLTRDAVEQWFGHLTTELPEPSSRPTGHRQHPRPLGISAARLSVDAVMGAWEWGRDSDDYGDVVLRPRRPELPMPVGSVTVAPTWDQMDAVIGACLRFAAEARTGPHRAGWEWRARALTVARCTGLRSSQVMGLRWDDIDLEGRTMTVHGALGKSHQERAGRLVPLAPVLAELLSGWGRREGWIVGPELRQRVVEAVHLYPAWSAARVGHTTETEGAPIPERVYRGTGAKGQGLHAFRKGFKTGLMRAGVDSRVRDLLVGHHAGGVDRHYLDLWASAVEAVAQVPELSADAAVPVVVSRVVPFRR